MTMQIFLIIHTDSLRTAKKRIMISNTDTNKLKTGFTNEKYRKEKTSSLRISSSLIKIDNNLTSKFYCNKQVRIRDRGK
jgi:hypothetical protein